MKKYIKPAIVEVAIDSENILAGSLDVNNEKGNRSVLADDLDLDWDEE